MTRVVFQAPNTVGLGHISRLAAIALAVRELDPAAAVLFAVEGDDHGLLAAAGLPMVSIPGPGPRSELLRGWPALAAEVADAVVRAARPDVVVFDCVPSEALFDAARRHGVPLAVCLRAMAEASVRRLLPALCEADVVLVPHTREEFAVPPELAAKARYVGPIVRPVLPSGDSAAWHVVVTGGGGGYPGTVDFYNQALAALDRCRRADPDLAALLVTGPLFTDWHRLRPVDGVRIVPFEPDLARLFATAGVVVCQAGYNTVAELVSLGGDTICRPADRDLDDQHARAAAAARRNPAFRVLDDPDPDRLADLIRRVLAARAGRPRAGWPRSARATAGRAGARAAAQVVLDVAGRGRGG